MPTPEQSTINLMSTTDASEWAAEWCKVARRLVARGVEDDRGDEVAAAVIDEGWMLSWFANAIEAGRAAGRQEIADQYKAQLDALEADAVADLTGAADSLTELSTSLEAIGVSPLSVEVNVVDLIDCFRQFRIAAEPRPVEEAADLALALVAKLVTVCNGETPTDPAIGRQEAAVLHPASGPERDAEPVDLDGIDTVNDHLVSSNGQTFTMLKPLIDASPESTLRAAAWMVLMAEPFSSVSFVSVYAAIRRT